MKISEKKALKKRNLTELQVILAVQEGDCETTTSLAEKVGFTGESARQAFYSWLDRRGLRLKHQFQVVPKKGYVMVSED